MTPTHLVTAGLEAITCATSKPDAMGTDDTPRDHDQQRNLLTAPRTADSVTTSRHLLHRMKERIEMRDSELDDYRRCLEIVLQQSREFRDSESFIRGVDLDLQRCDDEILRRLTTTPTPEPTTSAVTINPVVPQLKTH